MHTNVDIDEELIAEALRRSGLSTKRAVVEAGLRALLTLRSQEEVRDLRGRLHWRGDEAEPSPAASAAAPAAPAASAASAAKRKPGRKGPSGARPR
jgi:Arc/MetJ family transcription regulator